MLLQLLGELDGQIAREAWKAAEKEQPAWKSVVAIVLVAFAGSIWMIPRLGFDLVPTFSQGEFSFLVELPEGTEMVMPGDNVQMTVSLIAPIAMEEGLRFAVREGGRTVGAGVVSKIIE